MKSSGRKSIGKVKSTPSQTTRSEGSQTVAQGAARQSAFPVVGVGASAGGLAAITDLLKHLPAGLGAAFVIVQHLDPKHESLSSEILSRVSPIPVSEVQDGMRIRPSHVYVIPPNRNMHLKRGVLTLTPRIQLVLAANDGRYLEAVDVRLAQLEQDFQNIAEGKRPELRS